jgi:hypothetical protein
MDMFFHGMVEVKKDDKNHVKGSIGIVTAYLPEDETFAVIWAPEGPWITYKEKESEFLERFRFIPDDNQEEITNLIKKHQQWCPIPDPDLKPVQI